MTLHFQINGEATRTDVATESPEGDVYGGNNAYNVYYHYLQGEVPDLKIGDSVEYCSPAAARPPSTPPSRSRATPPPTY